MSFVSLFVVAVLALVMSSLSPLIAYAASPADSFTPDQEATSYSYYVALGGCIQNNMFGDFTTTVAENGNAKPSEWFDDNQAFGYIYPNGTKTDCKDIASKALSLWGWANTEDFLKAMKYTYSANTAEGTPSYHGTADGATRVKDFQQAVQAQIYGSAVSSPSGAAVYDIDFNAFAQNGGACAATDLGPYSGLKSTQKAYVDAGTTSDGGSGGRAKTVTTYVKLPVVDPTTGASVDHGYTYTYTVTAGVGTSSTTDLVTLYGYHTTAKTATCEDLAAGIKKNASANSAWVVLNKKPDTTSNVCQTNPSAAGCSPDTKTSCNIDQLGWILCPVLTTAAQLADGAYGFLADNFLSTDPSLVNTDPNATTPDGAKVGTGTYQAWKIMQAIANVAFVIVFLIIIFSQLTSAGVSNFGVKKLLPRLIVGAVLVNVSFYLCQIAVDLSNILGYSLKDLLSSVADQVVKSGGGTAVNTTDDSSNLFGIVTAIITAGAVVWINLSAVTVAAVGAIVSLLVIFVILVTRKVLIVLLIVVAPLAFVAYLLPNTESWFKRWRTLFVQMLMLFPIIGLLYGGSLIASEILRQIAGDNVVLQIAAYVALVVPLIAAIPLLRASLNGVGKLGGAIQGFGSRVRGTAQSGAKTAYDRSHLGQFREYRRAEADKRRGLIRGGVYKGSNRNPLNWIRNARSGGNQLLNQATGRFGDRLEASGIEAANKQEAGEIAAAQQLLQSRVTGGKATAKAELADALRRGDVVKAKAAQNVMFSQGAAGMRDFYDAVAEAQRRKQAHASAVAGLRENISTNHGQMVKTKAADVSKWAALGGDLIDFTDDPSTWAGLSQADLAGQTGQSLQRAADAGLLDAAAALQLLANQQLNGNLDPSQISALQQAAGATPATTTISAPTPSAAGPVGSEWINSDVRSNPPPPSSGPGSVRGSYVDGQGRSTPSDASGDYHDRMSK